MPEIPEMEDDEWLPLRLISLNEKIAFLRKERREGQLGMDRKIMLAISDWRRIYQKQYRRKQFVKFMEDFKNNAA